MAGYRRGLEDIPSVVNRAAVPVLIRVGRTATTQAGVTIAVR